MLTIQPDITQVLLASNAGTFIQALLSGSCLQLARTYYRTRRDDPLLAKLGIAWITFVLILAFVFANLQQSLVISYMERFTAWQFQDFVRYSAGCIDLRGPLTHRLVDISAYHSSRYHHLRPYPALLCATGVFHMG